MKKKILFVTATHGNEGFSIPIIEKLFTGSSADKFDWIIGNPRALKENKRFIDADLNRVSPGKKISNKYEIRRAYELKQKLNQYDYVIDLHGTPANTGIFTIVTNPKIENLILAASLPFKNIVIWSPRDLNKPGPLTQFVKCGVEIECGPKGSKQIQKELFEGLRKFLNKPVQLDYSGLQQKRFYRVFGTLTKEEYEKNNIRLNEFEEVDFNSNRFSPLLINRYEGVACYKMEEINFWIDYLFKQMLINKKIVPVIY